MKYLIGIILCIVLIIAINLVIQVERVKTIRQKSGLNIPLNISDSKYMLQNLNDEYIYPYVFFSKFKIRENDYFRMVNKKLISRLDSNNAIYIRTLGQVFKNKDYFWGFNFEKNIKYPTWWRPPKKLKLRFLFSNFFMDSPIVKYGDLHSNGRIVSYYDGSYCYIYIECWIPSNASSNNLLHKW